MKRRSFLFVPLLAALAPWLARAQPGATFPNHAVRLIVPFAPGGLTDIYGRLLGQKLSELWGEPFLVENLPGAAGDIGIQHALQRPADGYTIFIAGGGNAIKAALPNRPYSLVDDLAALGMIGTLPGVMLVPNASPAKTVAEFIALARRSNGKLNFASSGNGATPHLTGEMFKVATGIQMTHVPYKGSSLALTDLMGNHVDVMFDPLASSLPLVRNGDLRALAVTGAQRSESLPEVPTLKELGIDVEAVSYVGLYGSRKLPAEIVQKYNDAIRAVMKQPDMRARLKDLGTSPHDMDATEFGAFTQAEVAHWAQVIKTSGITME